MPRSRNEVRVLQPSAQLIDPHTWTDSPDRLNIRFSIFEPLVRYNVERRDYDPALARGWSVETGARIWTLDLRSDVLFHNGDRLQAEDVVATLDRARDPEMAGELGTKGLLQTYLGDAEIQAVGEYQVRIVTAEPMADLLDLLVEIPILPRRAMTKLPEAAVGSGPFRLAEMRDNSVAVEAFDRYWGAQPAVDGIHWIAEPDEARRVQATIAGEADVITELSPEEARIIGSGDRTRVVTSDSSVCAVFMCNLFSGPCADRRVRKALNYALNVRELIQSVMAGAGKPLNGPLTPHHLGYDPSTPSYGHEPAKARELLMDAGFGEGLAITLDVPTTVPDRAPALAHRMAEQYTRIGITTEVREFTDRPAYAQMVRAKEIDDACCFDSSPLSTYRVLREKFHSGMHGPWWQGYENPDVDELLDQAAQTPAVGPRQELYRRAYGLIRDDAPWIFLFRPQHLWGVRESVCGLQTTVNGVISF